MRQNLISNCSEKVALYAIQLGKDAYRNNTEQVLLIYNECGNPVLTNTDRGNPLLINTE
jgi:hypothetical protein